MRRRCCEFVLCGYKNARNVRCPGIEVTDVSVVVAFGQMVQRVAVGDVVEMVDADKVAGPDGEPVGIGALYGGAAVPDGEAGVRAAVSGGIDRNSAGGVAPEHGAVCWGVAVGFTVVFHYNAVLEKVI